MRSLFTAFISRYPLFPVSCYAYPHDCNPNPPASRWYSNPANLVVYLQGQPSHSKTACRLRSWMRETQNLARPKRSQRNLKCQLSPDDPQTRVRWPHHSKASHDALACPRSGTDGCEANWETSRIRKAEGYCRC